MPGELQKKAKMLCWRYNQTSPEEGDVRAEILRELLGTCHPLTFIEPSFRCDYGFNIHTHGLTVINYNCVKMCIRDSFRLPEIWGSRRSWTRWEPGRPDTGKKRRPVCARLHGLGGPGPEC